MNRYPKELEQFIRENMDGKSNKQIALMVSEYGIQMTDYQVNQYIKNHHMHRKYYAKRERPCNAFPIEIEKFIKQNCELTGPMEMTGKINAHFGTSYTRSQIRAFYHNHNINSGLTGRWGERSSLEYPKTHAVNSGCFKKGNMPWNTCIIGDERKTTDGYWKVKVADPNTWKFKHIIVWEQHNGPVRKGMNITFLDGNHDNCNIENLMEISNGENAFINSKHLRGDSEVTMAAVCVAKLNHAIIEKQKGRK